MATESELENQYVPINSLRIAHCYWVIKILVIGVGPEKEYKNDNNEGVRCSLTFVDEEGTKIQATLFNKLVTKWKGKIVKDKTYYIINGMVNAVSSKFASVHKELEIIFSETTTVTDCNGRFSSVSLSNNFISFEEASEHIDGSLFDIVGIVVNVKPIVGQGKKIRKEIVLMNEQYDRKTVTLWNELALNEDDMLQKMILENPVVALCDVKSTIYRGQNIVSTLFVSSILINPTFEKALALQNWHHHVKAQQKDITLMPSKLIKETRLVRLANIIHDSFDISKDTYCKFNAKITNLLNIDDPWYASCKKCSKKVKVENNIATCPRCDTVDYEERYLLLLAVADEEKEHSFVSLFEGAKYLIGCDLTTYKESISNKKEESKYYRKLLSSLNKEFTFLIKIDGKFEAYRAGRRLVVAELHEIEEVGPIEIEDQEIQLEITTKKNKILEENNSLVLYKKIKVEKNS